MTKQYTFRRPKKRPDIYTDVSTVDDSEAPTDSMARYIRYSFFIILLIFVLLAILIFYIFAKGLPVKVKG